MSLAISKCVSVKIYRRLSKIEYQTLNESDYFSATFGSSRKVFSEMFEAIYSVKFLATSKSISKPLFRGVSFCQFFFCFVQFTFM